MAKQKFKLYVWTEVLSDYTDGIMFAWARSLPEARAMLLKGCDFLPSEDLNKQPEIWDLRKPRGACLWGGG